VEGPSVVQVLVEIARGGRNKYELDKATGRMRLDRVLYSPLHYPADYGFILDTVGEDGDPLDALVVTREPTFPGCLLPARPVGVLDMRDDKGRDHKILAVPTGDPSFAEVSDLAGLAPHFLAEIEHFFQVYKTLERKETEIYGWSGVESAWTIIAAARERYSAGSSSAR
jgi:inorganic pyrophosphatase